MIKVLLITAFVSVVFFALSGVILADGISNVIARRLKLRVSSPLVAFFVLLFAFTALVSLGLSGSSMKSVISSAAFIRNEVTGLIGKSRPIRSDEAAVMTPLVIGQYNHVPKFPVLNKNLGPDGLNMLIVGGSGVPVYHVSAMAKPATWGFFFLDLPRALAWYWWLPVFGCLLSLWALLNQVFPGNWKVMLALSAAYTFSPYAAAWSFWPAYTIMFPALAMTMMLLFMKSRSLPLLIGLSFSLGLSIAGYVLVLYPPWQVPLGYLFLFLFAGVVVRDRLYRIITIPHVFMLAIAAGTSGMVLYFWKIDAQQAITALMQTVYPGHRTASVGGDIEPFYWLKGISSAITLHGTFGYSNQCEMASFLYLIFPVFFGVAYRFVKTGKPDPVALSVMVFFCAVTFFQFAGFSPDFAALTLMGRSTSSRTDIAVGFAQMILVAFVAVSTDKGNEKQDSKRMMHIMSAAVSGLWVLLLMLQYQKMAGVMPELVTGVNAMVTAAVYLLIAIIGLAGYFLLMGRVRTFLFMYCLMNIAIILPFNPVIRAPDSITVEPVLLEQNTGRILVLDNNKASMMLLAAGFPVVNGVHFYPQQSIWVILDPDGQWKDRYNRYQHLFFNTGDDAQGGSHFTIENPQPDVVRIMVDAAKFDFRKIGVGTVMVRNEQAVKLENNLSIERNATVKGWSVFHVLNEKRTTK
jgi:hypothetical protein